MNVEIKVFGNNPLGYDLHLESVADLNHVKVQIGTETAEIKIDDLRLALRKLSVK